MTINEDYLDDIYTELVKIHDFIYAAYRICPNNGPAALLASRASTLTSGLMFDIRKWQYEDKKKRKTESETN